jgi:hypothetical protein
MAFGCPVWQVEMEAVGHEFKDPNVCFRLSERRGSLVVPPGHRVGRKVSHPTLVVRAGPCAHQLPRTVFTPAGQDLLS